MTSTNALCPKDWDTQSQSCADPNPYSGYDEVDISHGDSGGPSFYDGELIGVHDLGICFGSSSCDEPPAVNASNNSFFGDLFGDVSVPANATWIQAQETTPEPLSFLLVALGLGGLAWRRRRVTTRATRTRMSGKL